LHWQGKIISITADFYLELNPSELSAPDAAHFPFELHLVNGSGQRLVLLRSTLARILNNLQHLRKHLPIALTVGPSMPTELHQVLANKSVETIEAGLDDVFFVSRLYEDQLGLVGIFGAIASVAFIVVGFLVTGQIRRFGDISGLGLSLGSLLIAIPALIAVHLWLGLVRVSFNCNALRVDVRRGFIGTICTSIPKAELQGAWLIDGPGRLRQLLLRCYDSYCSFPIDRTTRANLKARFERPGWHRTAD
jgi:hypothetical protein